MLNGACRYIHPAAGKLLLLVALSVLCCSPAGAQQAGKGSTPFVYDTLRHARSTNGAISVGVEKRNGRFWMEADDGTPLLFCRGEGLTSFSNLRFQGITFTNNTLVGPRIPALTSPMPEGIVTEAADRVVFTVTLSVQGRQLECTQEFMPMLEADYAFVRVTTRLRNRSSAAVTAGMQQMYDLFLGTSDVLQVVAGGTAVARETGWDAPSVPPGWTATAAGSPLQARGRLSGAGLTPPDRFIVGRWQFNGYLGAAYWNYAATGFEMWDNAVLMQWNERTLAPGESAVLVTDYGYATVYRASLACRADSVALNTAQTAYIPDPFRVHADVRNTGNVTIPSIAARITLPPGVSFAGSDSALAGSPAPLTPGAVATLSWALHAQRMDSGAILSFPVALVVPAELAQQCEARVRLPRVTVESASLACPDTLFLAVNAAWTDYAQNPFTILARVTNTGNVPLLRVQAALTLPPGMTLASGSPFQQVFPDTIQPGATGSAQWRVSAQVRQSDTVLVYAVDVSGSKGSLAVCSGAVFVPRMPIESVVLACPDTLRLALDSLGSDYVPNPFTLLARATNTGNVPLVRARAELILPPGLSLASGTAVQQLLPDTIPPGATGSAVWTVQAATSFTDTRYVYTIEVTGSKGVLYACAGAVFAPALRSPCVPVGVTTKGTDFWTAFPYNSGSGAAKDLVLYIVAAEDSRVRVTEMGTGVPATYIIPAGTVRRIVTDNSNDYQTPERLQSLGVHVTSDRPVAVYSASLVERHSDASIVLPTHALGMSYATAGYNFEDPTEHVLIVATEDGSTVTIDPFSMTSTSRPPRVPFSVQMNAGDTYYVRALLLGAFGGLTGTLISADKPVAVLSGAHTGWIPVNSIDWYGYLNPHYDQMLPEDLLGTEYIAVPFRGRLGGDTFKAVAVADSTQLVIGSDPPVALAQRGDPYEFPLDHPERVSANKPFLLAQFANSAEWDSVTLAGEYGDGSMVILSPTDRFAHCFSVPNVSSTLSDALQHADSYVNIVVPAGAERSVLVNGAVIPDTAYRTVPGAAYSYIQMPLQWGLNSVECSDPRGIGAIVYGFEYHDAYTYNAGFRTERHHSLTAVEREPAPAEPVLEAPYPNPATRSATVSYSLPRAGAMELALCDALGRLRRIVASGYRPEGRGSITVSVWDLPPGMYTLVLRQAGRTLQQTLMVLP